MDPSNGRISLIVQYIVENNDADDAQPAAHTEPKNRGNQSPATQEKPVTKTSYRNKTTVRIAV
jgi:hypothetical protein